MQISRRIPSQKIVASLVASLFVAGCSVSPKAIDPKEQKQLLAEDRVLAQQNVEPVGEELLLHEAVARGLKYNLEHRSRMLEQTIALGTSDLSKYDMLPRLLANAGYTYRDKDFISRSTIAATGEPSGANLTVSSDRAFSTNGFSLTWNMLDFGISYFNAKQNADRVLVASERRRRNMHVLVQDIQVAYLRAAAASKLKADLVRTINDANEAIVNAKQVEKEGLRPLLDTLRYQKTLLDNVKILQTIDQELSSARIELNQLLNLPATTVYKLEDPDQIQLPETYATTDTLEFEIRALMANADLNESIYNARIAADETRKSLLKYLPGLTFNYGPQNTTNSYVVNRSWVEGAAQVSFNLFNLLAAPAANRLADQNKELADKKRMTVQMAVVSQVHLVKQQLENALQIYKLSADIDGVDGRLAKIAADREKQGAASKAERVAAESAAIVSRLRKYQALSQLFAASGKMQATTGLEPRIGSLDAMSLKDLTVVVKESFDRWNSGKLPELPPELKPAPVEPPKAEPAPESPSFLQRLFKPSPAAPALAEPPKVEEPAPPAPAAAEPPKVEEPAAPAPAAEQPKIESIPAPAVEPPKAEEPATPAPAPAVEPPKAEEPVAPAPVPAAEPPKAEEPAAPAPTPAVEPIKVEEPKAEEPAAPAPAPALEAPKAEEPATPTPAPTPAVEPPKAEEPAPAPAPAPAVEPPKAEEPAAPAPAAEPPKPEPLTPAAEEAAASAAKGEPAQVPAAEPAAAPAGVQVQPVQDNSGSTEKPISN